MTRIYVEIEKINGFSTLSVGDKYEVVFKHGSQIIKSKVKIMKYKAQQWKRSNITMFSSPYECIEIHTVKRKLLGKKIIDKKKINISELYQHDEVCLVLDIDNKGSNISVHLSFQQTNEMKKNDKYNISGDVIEKKNAKLLKKNNSNTSDFISSNVIEDSGIISGYNTHFNDMPVETIREERNLLDDIYAELLIKKNNDIIENIIPIIDEEPDKYDSIRELNLN
uniref:PL48 domain-containing protein n=1 Tax=Parastrongyloides trichosuri TaxID=131310 RepID=A0A0N4Z0K4_PARTI